MAGAWLEVRSCDNGGAKELDGETVLRFPTLSEAIKVAEGAAGDAQRKGDKYWEYSIRLAENELEEISVIFTRTSIKDDGRSEQRTIDVRHNGRCYALTLFVFKE